MIRSQFYVIARASVNILEPRLLRSVSSEFALFGPSVPELWLSCTRDRAQNYEYNWWREKKADIRDCIEKKVRSADNRFD